MMETEKFVPTQSRVFAKLKRGKKWNENNKTGKKSEKSVHGLICHVQY